MSEFAMSVIIPVYNNESTLEKTLESVVSQGLDENETEIVLIDDGSADQSGAICDLYAKKYPDRVKVLHKQNRGVSSARNAGMDMASGRYFLFLDGDDILGEGSVREIISFFDANKDKVDIVTYPLVYVYANGKTWRHWRYKDTLKCSGIYDLTDRRNAQIAQSTMNICIKASLKERFDESRDLFEDQMFITNLLKKKKAIGYVDKATYYYVRSGDGAVSTTMYPIYCYDQMISSFEELIEIKKEVPELGAYIDSFLVYNFNWRIKSDVLIPYHFKGEDFKREFGRFVRVVNAIDNRNILEYKRIDRAHKYWIISLKTENKPRAVVGKKGISLKDDNGILEDDVPIQIVFTKIRTEGDSVFVLGFLKCNVLDMMESVKVYLSTRNGERELTLGESCHSFYASKMKTNTYYAFSCTVNVKGGEKLSFCAELNGRRFPADVYFVAKSGMDSEIRREYMNRDGYAFWREGNSLRIKPGRKLFLMRRIRKEYRIAKRYPRQILKRQVMRLFSRRGGIWLYTDSNDTVDNGFWQFLHDIKKKDGVERYYVCTKKALKLMPGDTAKRYRDRFVQFDSMQHKKLLMRADYVLAAYIGVRSFSPYGAAYINAYRDFFHFKTIYLQHGVMNAKIPTMYSNEKLEFVDGVVCSTNFEHKNLLELSFPESELIDTGMSRFDFMKKVRPSDGKTRILFAPSWRSNLVQTVTREQKPVTRFYDSKFYRQYKEFLDSPELLRVLEENNLYLDVQLHPMFSCYRGSMVTEKNERIREVTRADESDYACLITDFSSIMFDFLYLDKPVIGFFPDRYEFEAGVHNYREFYFPLEDGFMLFTESADGALEKLRELCENGMRIPDSIMPRVKNLFFDKTPNHRQRLYEEIIRRDGK